MESGTFNHNKKILNIVIKYSNNSELSKYILDEISSRSIREYIRDIRKCGVKTAYVFLEYKNIIVESYISGDTVDQILINNSDNKMEVLRNLLKVYKCVEKNKNLCLDWNLKNFIYHKNEIYYIDFVPCIYKDKLLESNSNILKEYIASYLDSNITLSGIYYHILKTMLDVLNKKEMLIFSEQLLNLYSEELNVSLNFNNNHPYSIGIKKINNYINTNLDIKTIKEQLNACSLGEITNDNFQRRHV